MWVGSELPRLAWLSLSSAIQNGYKPVIYLYDDTISVPFGSVKKDANSIVDSSDVFLRHGRYTNFSDLFRYTLLQKFDCVWFDLDCIFTDSAFPIEQEYLFAYELLNPIVVGTGLLKYPTNSKLSNALLSECNSLIDAMRDDFESGKWEVFGPELFTKCVFDYGLPAYIKPMEYMYPIGWTKDELRMLIDPHLCELALERINSPLRSMLNACLIHVWASGIDMNFSNEEFNKYSTFPDGSLLAHYDKLFRIERSV